MNQLKEFIIDIYLSLFKMISECRILLFLLGFIFYTIDLSAQNLDVKILPVWDGTTEEVIAVNDTFKITNPKQLAWISEQHVLLNNDKFENKVIFLMNDIDLGGASTPPKSWVPIGLNLNNKFIGNFDGNNKKILNLYIDTTCLGFVLLDNGHGLFGCSDYKECFIKNVILENININAASNCDGIGGIIGVSGDSLTIENCHVSGSITGNQDCYCGGIGLTSSIRIPIKNCSSNCIFYGYRAYAISTGKIESCYSTCQSYVDDFYGMGTTVQSCYNINGFVNQGKGFGNTAYNSYIAATQVINEIIDSNQHSVNCYYDSITYGSQSGRIAKGRGLDTAFMKTAAFVDSLNQGLSEKKWKQDYSDCPVNNGFPILVWQKKKQTIIWESKTDTLYVGDYYTPTATSTSGLPVSYYVYDFFHWITFPDKFLVTQAGEAVLIAKQEGDSIYAQAPLVYKKFHFLERTYMRRDIKIEEIMSPVADSCYAEGSMILPKVKIVNSGSVNATNIVIHVNVDSAGTIIQSFAETIPVIDTNTSYTFEFPFGFTVPTMPNSNNKVKTTMYINTLNNDTNLNNDTLSVYFSVKQVNINENKIQIFELGQNYPNPANTRITIPYTLPQQGNVLFKIMSINGKVLYKEAIHALQGNNKIDINTDALSNGMYYYSMEYKRKTIMRKMIIHK